MENQTANTKFRISRKKMMVWLFQAYLEARKHKRATKNQLIFEMDLQRNLWELMEDILTGEYQLSPGTAFIVKSPKVREIFAATFRDRVVHHFVYNFIAPYWEKQLIYDCYSCRKGKGASLGVKRMRQFARAASDNYRREAWVLKIDIVSYFTSMRRDKLYPLVETGIDKMKLGSELKRCLKYLLTVIIFTSPTKDVQIKGSLRNWDLLPAHKSLFNVDEKCGFPIGNLTSQMFANIYMHLLDLFIKQRLQIPYYGRYVDDLVLIAERKEDLLVALGKIRDFAKSKLGLTVHAKKIYLQEVKQGVEFLGIRIVPNGVLPGKRCRQEENKRPPSVVSEASWFATRGWRRRVRG